MSHASKFAERLLSQAELYRHMARECCDEELAATLRQSARECVDDATELEERLPKN